MKRLLLALLLLLPGPALAYPARGGALGGAADTGGVSGGTAHCPYDTNATDLCGADTVTDGEGMTGSDNFFLTLAPTSGQNYNAQVVATIDPGNVLNISSIPGGGTPFQDNLGHLIKRTISNPSAAVPIPAGIYVQSQISGTAGGVGRYQLSGSGTIQPSQTFNAIARPPWNLCGIDYGCGKSASVTTLKDPAISANWTGTGCTYAATGGAIGPKVTCNISSPTTISGFDFSTIGGHACTSVRFGTASADFTIENNRFEEDGTCMPMITGSVVFFSQALFTPTINITIRHNTIIGHASDDIGRCAATGSQYPCFNKQSTGTFSFFNFTNAGNTYIYYNYFKDFPGRVAGTSTGTPCAGPTTPTSGGSAYFGANYNTGTFPRVVSGHGAMKSQSCYYFYEDLYNVSFWPTNGSQQTTLTAVYSMDPNTDYNGTYKGDHNLIIANPLQGATSTASVTFNYSVATTGVVTVTSGTAYPGLGIQGADAYLYNALGGNTYNYDCAFNPPGTSLLCGSYGSTFGTAYMQNQGPGTGTASLVSPALAGYAIGHAHGTIHQIIFDTNYIDSLSYSTSAFGLNAGTCENTSIITNNLDIRTLTNLDTSTTVAGGC